MNEPPRPRGARFRWLSIPAFALAAALAGCSSSASSPSAAGSSSSPTAGSASAAALAYSRDQIAQYEGAPAFIAPGPAFSVSKLRGKSIAVIPATSNEYDNTIEAQMKAIAAQYGVNYTEYPNQGQPTQWVSALNQAIATKPSLIILNTALDPRQVLPEVEQAKAQGIPVIATHFFDQTYSGTLHTSCGAPASLCAAGLTATVNAPFDLATKIESDWIIADSGAHAHVLVITANDAAPTAGMVAAAQAEFHQHCPGCQVTVANVLVSEWTTKIPTLVQTALARDPNLHYVLPLFDFGAPYAANGVNLAGKAGQVKIVTYNGTQSVLAMVENHSSVAVDVGEPLNWLAYAFMDQAFRVLAGVAPAADEHTPFRVFTAANVAETGTPPTVTGGYGNAYLQGYQQLWQRG
jgi:ribose transport system substrate-binding protein